MERKVLVTKLIKLIGESPNGWQEAVENALEEANKTVRHIKRLYVDRFIGVVENGKIREYRAVVTLAFEVER